VPLRPRGSGADLHVTTNWTRVSIESVPDQFWRSPTTFDVTTVVTHTAQRGAR